MEYGYYLFVLFTFLAVVLALEGALNYWNNVKGEDAQRLERRLRAISAGQHGSESSSLIRQRSYGEMSGVERALMRLPRVHQFDRLMQQAGSTQTVPQFIIFSVILAVAALLATILLSLPLIVVIALPILVYILPFIRLLAQRRKRLRLFEEQLPGALDLISRALRAGHAFSGGLDMVGKEANEPLAGEFRTTFDEVNFGVPMQEALLNLVARVPVIDLRYFVIAVLLQRDTGGNLAELLDNLAALIRARFKLLGTIRALSAEGRLSAWVLSLLPFAAAAMMFAVRPQLMKVLWTDPAGPTLIGTTVVMMVFGIIWMRQIIKIRV